MGDQIPRVLSYSSSDYSQYLSLLIIRQTGPGGDHLGQVVRILVLFSSAKMCLLIAQMCPDSDRRTTHQNL
jgi:hypothetical protein